MQRLISIIIVILTISCKTDKENYLNYFGGEIINPKSDFVLFLKDDEIIDTLFLNKNNRFLNEYKAPLEGLYTFKHGNEFQYIYMEPNDSILIRLNTWDFDESLVYSGKGSEKNNYLIHLFLQNEKEEMDMMQYFNLNPTDFQLKLDSLEKERLSIYNEFAKNEEEISEDFQKLTDAAIHLTLYRLKEIYPMYHKLALKSDKYPSVPDDFYNFRDGISLNQANLVSFYSYQNYVMSYLYHLSYGLEEIDSTKNDITSNILNAINENIELESFKNNLLMRVTVDNFFNSESTCTINENVLSIFLENCSNEDYKKQVKNLVNDAQYVTVEAPLDDFEIVTYDNQLLHISSVIKNNNSVIYFWSTEHITPEYLLKRIQYLEQSYPDIKFIGINIQNTAKNVLKEPSLRKLDITKQFKLPENSYAHNYLTSNYPRTILVSKEGLVKNGFSMLTAKKFYSELEKLEIN